MTLSIVRDHGTTGDVFVHYNTRPAFAQPPSNQASANEDYVPKTHNVFMREGATSAWVTITILPVRFWVIYIHHYEIYALLADRGCTCFPLIYWLYQTPAHS